MEGYGGDLERTPGIHWSISVHIKTGCSENLKKHTWLDGLVRMDRKVLCTTSTASRRSATIPRHLYSHGNDSALSTKFAIGRQLAGLHGRQAGSPVHVSSKLILLSPRGSAHRFKSKKLEFMTDQMAYFSFWVVVVVESAHNAHSFRSVVSISAGRPSLFHQTLPAAFLKRPNHGLMSPR